MSLRERLGKKLGEAVDKQYEAHPAAKQMRDELDASGVQFSVVGDKYNKPDSGRALVDTRQDYRRQQAAEAGGADLPGAAEYASHVAVKHITEEHTIPVEAQHEDHRVAA